MRTLHIRIESLANFGAAFADALEGVKAGERRGEPYEAVSFASYEDMHDVLSPARIALVKVMAGQRALSFRDIARRAGRDVQAVHRDVTKLIHAGVVERTPEGVRFDYDRLSFEYDVEADVQCSVRDWETRQG